MDNLSDERLPGFNYQRTYERLKATNPDKAAAYWRQWARPASKLNPPGNGMTAKELARLAKKHGERG